MPLCDVRLVQHEATQLSAKLRKLNSKREELTEEAREEEPPNIQAIEHAKAVGSISLM